MWECGYIVSSRVISEAKGLGFTMCLYPCSLSEEWQGGWKAGVSVWSVSLCTLWK